MVACKPHTDFTQGNIDEEHNGGDTFDANAVEGPLAHESELPDPLQPRDQILFYPTVCPKELAQGDSPDFAHLLGPQIGLPERQNVFTIGTVPGAYGAQHDFRPSTDQVELRVQAWNQNNFVEPRQLHPCYPHGYYQPSPAEEAFFEQERAPAFRPQGALQHQSDERSWPVQESHLAQRPSHLEAADAASSASFGDPELDAVLQQAQSPQHVTIGLEALSGDAPPKSAICPVCQHQLKDAPGLRYGVHITIKIENYADTASRHHLDIHDPVKVRRNKCEHEDCDYASRYPKDVRRHQLVHKKPKDPKFVCSEPGCDRKFHRNDFLLRHCRSAHRIASAADAVRSNKKRGPRPKHLTVPNPRRQRASSVSSTTTSRRNRGSSTSDRRMIQQVPQTPVRPSRMSVGSSSAVVSIDYTHGNSTPGFDNNSLMPTPYTGMTSFTGWSDSQYFPSPSPSESFYFSAPGSPLP